MLVLVLHVQVDQVVPVPPVHRQNDQDEEIRREDERFRRRHATAARETSRSDYIVAYVDSRKRLFTVRSFRMTESELQRLLDAVRAGTLDAGTPPRRASSTRCARRRSTTWASRASTPIAICGRAFPKSSSGSARRRPRSPPSPSASSRAGTRCSSRARRRRRTTPCARLCPNATYHDEARAITLAQGDIPAGTAPS